MKFTVDQSDESLEEVLASLNEQAFISKVNVTFFFT